MDGSLLVVYYIYISQLRVCYEYTNCRPSIGARSSSKVVAICSCYCCSFGPSPNDYRDHFSFDLYPNQKNARPVRGGVVRAESSVARWFCVIKSGRPAYFKYWTCILLPESWEKKAPFHFWAKDSDHRNVFHVSIDESVTNTNKSYTNKQWRIGLCMRNDICFTRANCYFILIV